MTRPLLAAIDFSAPSRHAAERAALLACRQQRPLLLLHVLNRGALTRLHALLANSSRVIERRLADDAREQLERLASELGERYRAPIEPILSEGNVADRIRHAAETRDVALVVIGARGERLPGHALLLGSTAERLLQVSPQPVLVVKHAPDGPWQRVLVPLDFAAGSALALQQAADLAPDAERIVLHAYELPFESKLRRAGIDASELNALLLELQQESATRMDALLAADGPQAARTTRVLRHGEASHLILTEQRERQCDLIVLAGRNLGRLPAWLLGSVSRRVLAEADGDLLMVQSPPD